MIEVTKASGEKEEYSREKFCLSLERSGASKDVVDKLCKKVEEKLHPGIKTEELYREAHRYLLKADLPAGARYSLKAAIMELGPAGFLFEQYLAAILRQYGYDTRTDQILQGACVSHEIDIIAQQGNAHFFVEAKYHNVRGVKTDVTVVMYSFARFLDIKETEEKKENVPFSHQAWIITNTKFTTKAISYGACKGLKMTGWHYPAKESLESLIEEKMLYPVTVIPSLDRFGREQFAKAGVMFAKDVALFQPAEMQRKFGISSLVANKIREEARILCARVQ